MTVWLFRLLTLTALLVGLVGFKPAQPVLAECSTGSGPICSG